MKMKLRKLPAVLFLFVLMLSVSASAAEYEAMQGVESANTVFDFRVGDPEAALGHLKLIHSMRKDPNLIINGRQPEIVVVFIGSAVNLISRDRPGFGQEQQGQLDAIAEQISAMDQSGITMEICLTAAHAQEVDPDSILPEINKVGNGWISLVGYQQQGYAMIADF